jgi:hypothetical protein
VSPSAIDIQANSPLFATRLPASWAHILARSLINVRPIVWGPIDRILKMYAIHAYRRLDDWKA